MEKVKPFFHEAKVKSIPQAYAVGKLCQIYYTSLLYVYHHGFSVIPVNFDKKPLLEWKEYQRRRPTLKELYQWFYKDQKNIAIVTGRISDLIVLDIDGEEGQQSLKENKLLPLDETPCVKTGRGYHLYYHYRDGVKNLVKILPGIDLRSEGGYVVAPPSKHSSGAEYSWIVPLTHPRLEPPEWIISGSGNTSKQVNSNSAQKENTWVDELLAGVEKGRRNISLARLTGHYLAKGISPYEVEKLMLAWNKNNKPPLDQKEVITTVRSIVKKHEEKKRITEKKIERETERFTEFYNADRFVERYKGQVLFCKPWDSWLIYQDGRWQKDNSEKALALAKKVVLSYYSERENLDDKEGKALIRWALKSETKNMLKSMLELAKPDLAILPEEFDKDPYLFNVKNGTYNLRDDEFIEHNPEHLLTMMANVEYNPNKDCPNWIDFLNTIFNYNLELIEFIQKALGYSLTGDVGEDCFFILYGTGANGKSTFLNVIQQILGDYAIQARADTFMGRDREYIPNDIARLNKKRFVAVTELPEGKRLNENLLKSLTGRDTISARFLRQEFFDFRPTFKLWFATNHKPLVFENTHAFWRRVKLIPFEVTIKEEDRIPHYEDLLLEEREGILNWILQGVSKWKEKGLGTTEKISSSTKEYREQNDILGDFIEERCLEDVNYSTTFKELYNEYKEWAEENNENVMTKNSLGRRLEERGYKAIKLPGGQRAWKGLKIKK